MPPPWLLDQATGGWLRRCVPGLGRAGSAWRAQVFALDMALLSECTQPDEKFVDDAAELASHDQPVEHGGDRVRWCVERLDQHVGPFACGRGEMSGEAVVGEHLVEPEGVVHDQERRASLGHRLDAPLDHGSFLPVHGHRAGARHAQASVVAAVFVDDGVNDRRPVGQLCVVHEQPMVAWCRNEPSADGAGARSGATTGAGGFDLYRPRRPATYALFAVSVALATVTLTFWWVDSGEFVSSFTNGGREFTSYPSNVYSGAVRRVFAYALGFAFVAYYPALALQGRPDPLGGPAWLG